MWENPMLVETSMGGSLTLDSYVSNVAMEERRFNASKKRAKTAWRSDY